MVRYNTVLDITRISVGPRSVILDLFSYITFLYNYTFYSLYNTIWIANTEMCLDPNNSVIKRLWCMCRLRKRTWRLRKMAWCGAIVKVARGKTNLFYRANFYTGRFRVVPISSQLVPRRATHPKSTTAL